MKKKIVSLLLTLTLGLVLTVPAFAANYSKWTDTEFSGQTDFGYFYTYAGQDQSTYPYQDANYKCFSVVSADGQRFYAAVKDAQYEYAKTALDNQSITLKGRYQQTAGDGSPIFLASEIVTTNEKGEKTNTPLGNVVWAAIDHGKTIAETFRKFYEVYSDRMIAVADDSSYLMIDTNPYNQKGGDSRLIEAGLDHIETLNKTLGLPDWLYEEILKTRALDGRQKESFDNVTVTWSYHPDQGMEVIYRSNH